MRRFYPVAGATQFPRAELKKLRIATRAKDPKAARELLAHSLGFGHRKLTLRRYFVAFLLGADGIDEYRDELRAVVKQMKETDIQRIAHTVAAELRLDQKELEKAKKSLDIDVRQSEDDQEISQ